MSVRSAGPQLKRPLLVSALTWSNIPQILSKYRNPLLAPVVSCDHSKPLVKLVPSRQKGALIWDLWYSCLPGVQTRCCYPICPELFAKPTIALPPCASRDVTDPINICRISAGVLSFVVASAALSDRREAAAGWEFVVAVRLQPRLPSRKCPH